VDACNELSERFGWMVVSETGGCQLLSARGGCNVLSGRRMQDKEEGGERLDLPEREFIIDNLLV